MKNPILFNQPILAGDEIAYVERSLKSGHLSAGGPFSEQASDLLRTLQGAQGVFLTTSCTDALEMGSMLLGLKPGDVVIVPSFTFVSTALAMVRQGVKLLFADIDRETLGIDPKHVANLLDERVRAIVPVHYAGFACDLAGLQALTQGRPIDLFEDNAQGLLATYQGRPLGSFGRLSALSFHETKNIVCGEGGALVVNRAEDLELAHLLLEKGTNRRAFAQGEVDKYTWVQGGSSFGMADPLAAYLLAQLERRHWIMARRKWIWDRYSALLAPASEALQFVVPRDLPQRVHSYHMFHLLLKDKPTRDRVLKGMRERNIQTYFHYTPLHDSAGARPHLDRPTECPVTTEISDRLLRLPFHNALTDEDVQHVASAFLEVLEGK